MFAVEDLCRVLSIGKSSYYQWLGRKESMQSINRRKLTEEIRTIFYQAKGRYGSPKIQEELLTRGIVCSKQRVAKIMQAEGLRSIIKKKYRVKTTESDHKLGICENHLNREFKQDSPSKAWVSDITYIPTDQGWIFLTIVMDLYDRKIIGWSLSNDMTTGNTIGKAWKMATVNREIKNDLIFHSDRGVQYASNEFKDLIKGKPIIQSMSRKGNCWDNAVAENFFKILKSELIYHKHFYSHFQARVSIAEFIEGWYNRQRRHSYLGYMTPVEFENKYYKMAA
jgi:transposase InsO family protein